MNEVRGARPTSYPDPTLAGRNLIVDMAEAERDTAVALR